MIVKNMHIICEKQPMYKIGCTKLLVCEIRQKLSKYLNCCVDNSNKQSSPTFDYI